MKWKKQGLIYSIHENNCDRFSHAQLPVVDKRGDLWRIYYATRNGIGQSNISYIEAEAGNPLNVVYEHPDVILDFGELGTFDDSGIMPTCVVHKDEQEYLYYVGWTKKHSVPYSLALGLAVSDNGGPFKKISNGPILGQSTSEPYFIGTASVEQRPNGWDMWYMSGTGWCEVEGKQESLYNIKHAASGDGIIWHLTGVTSIDFKNENEGGIAKPCVIQDEGMYKMWYSYRAWGDFRDNPVNSYRIGYAESKNGVMWERKDELANIDVSDSGWDSEMLAYPHVIKHKDKLFMFYNGNGFGRSGFGYAILG